jgi:hypothetical protein
MLSTAVEHAARCNPTIALLTQEMILDSCPIGRCTDLWLRHLEACNAIVTGFLSRLFEKI